MVIQLIYLQADGTKKTRTYRSVKPWEKSEMMSTFYNQRTLYRGGVMMQLKGTQRKLVARFGEDF